jgi:beta-galactosidase GanA
VDVKMRNILLICVLSVIVSACSTLTSLREDLDDTIILYNDLLRRSEYNKAKNFVDQSKREEFEARAKTAKNVKIVDYRILSADYKTEKGEHVVEVEFDYYVSPAYIVKTLTDKQKWFYVYVEQEKKKRWRLMSPLPEFK